MNSKLRMRAIDERIKLVEDVWDSIAADSHDLPLTTEQATELNRRLDAYETDNDLGESATDVVSRIRRGL